LVRGDTDDDDDIDNSILQLVYRKDGIANLELFTLVAQSAEVATVSLFVCTVHTFVLLLYMYVCTFVLQSVYSLYVRTCSCV